MVYITLKELKEILPCILEDQKVWMDDESWECVFNEIEQNCHIGKRLKGKKWKKKLREDVDELTLKVNLITPRLIADSNDQVDELTKKVDELRRYLTDNLSPRINRLSNDVEDAKSMAQTVKNRTDIDYTQMSKKRSDADAVQNVFNKMKDRGATKEELNTFRDLIHKYNALEERDICIKTKDCSTCKHNDLVFYNKQPCNSCNHYDQWEAKDND